MSRPLRSRLAPIAIVLLALGLAASCAQKRNYDRGDSIATSLHVMFGDPEENAASLGADVSAIFDRIGRDAREFPQAVSDFASFFY